MKTKVYSQLDIPAQESEVCSTQDLGVLDKTSITSVVEFMHKFQDDASFSPPTKEVMYDTDKYDIDIDSDDLAPDTFIELEELDEVIRSKSSS